MTEEFNRRLHESPEYRQEQLSAALDAYLMPEEQTALDAHLAGCDTCARELEELRQVRRLLRAMPEPVLPRSFLLPTEGELVAPRSPARTAERAAATNVTPLRQPTRPASRTLVVTRWIGTIAAVLGMALFLGTLLAHQGASYSATSAPSAAQPHDGGPNPAGGGGTANGGTIPSPTHTFSIGGPQATDKAATATSSSSPTISATMPAKSTGTPITGQASPSPGPTTSDILRTVALVLLFSGIALALASFVVARRL